MKSSLMISAIAACLALAVSFLDPNVAEKARAQQPTAAADLVVHEWGTFTSVAGKNGVALDWRPLGGPSDLPEFVYTMDEAGGYRQTYGSKFVPSQKGNIVARIRMETPVIYFYTKKEMEVSVSVDFPRGQVTEWYPQAGVVNAQFASGKTAGRNRAGGINWGTIKLLPRESPDFLREAAFSHYYPARETDSVPVQVCNADKTRIEKEKFLFYRGTGDFDLPLKVRLNGDRVVLDSADEKYLPKSDPGRNLTNLIVFENRGGRIGYELVPSVSGETVVARPPLTKDRARVFGELERILVGQGLYEREAKAMIETWKDSWFEEGLRVFYVLPRMTTDEILPLTVEPRPAETVRVLIGRAEVITPEMEKDVRRQVGRLRSGSAEERGEAQKNLTKYGRFYEPILKSILETEKDAAVRAQIEKLISIS